MRKLKFNSQRGSASAFVMIAMSFFLVTILGVYMISAKRAQTQEQTISIAQDKYYVEGEENSLHNLKIANSSEVIPIYTQEQLFAVGENAFIEIDGKVYDFSPSATYELKNDILINIDDTTVPKDFSSLETKGYNVYYYYNGEYYQYDSVGTEVINGYNYSFANLSEKIGYVTDGLIVHYDGIMNKSLSHDNTAAAWKDLSGNNNDGTLMAGPTWNTDSLNFDGVDDWVRMKELNYENVTLEIVALNTEINNYETVYICNYDSGGYGLAYIDMLNRFQVYIDSQYHFNTATDIVVANKKYALSGRYTGNTVDLFENGNKFTLEKTGTVGYPINNTVLAVGVNPSGSNAQYGFLNGKVYTVRVYNRALTDEEVLQNYQIDQARFDI